MRTKDKHQRNTTKYNEYNEYNEYNDQAQLQNTARRNETRIIHTQKTIKSKYRTNYVPPHPPPDIRFPKTLKKPVQTPTLKDVQTLTLKDVQNPLQFCTHQQFYPYQQFSRQHTILFTSSRTKSLTILYTPHYTRTVFQDPHHLIAPHLIVPVRHCTPAAFQEPYRRSLTPLHLSLHLHGIAPAGYSRIHTYMTSPQSTCTTFRDPGLTSLCLHSIPGSLPTWPHLTAPA
jgi:hypothetical protein